MNIGTDLVMLESGCINEIPTESILEIRSMLDRELKSRADSNNELVTKDSLWEHKKTGNRYRVNLVANQDATKEGYETTVVYSGVNGSVWCRPLSEWVEKFKFIE